MRKWIGACALILAAVLAGCGPVPQPDDAPLETGFVTEQILESDEGAIHYSYYLPEDYDPAGNYPMMVVMPG